MIQDVWSFLALGGAIAAFLFTYSRRNLLASTVSRWHDGPAWVKVALAGQASWMGYVAITIARGHFATPREAITLIISGLVSLVVFVNFAMNGRRAHGVRDDAHAGKNGSAEPPPAPERARRTFADPRGDAPRPRH